MLKVKLNKDTLKLTSLFNEKKGIYFIGGSVRDILLNKEPKDYDLYCANKIFKSVLNSLKSNPKVKLIKKDENYKQYEFEYENIKFSLGVFRTEIYKKPQYPKIYTHNNLQKDLSRRDFTINAIALDFKGRLIDPFEGLKDLEKKQIKFVGNPTIKIKEDPFRILRAIELKNKLNFKYEKQTKIKIKENAREISKIKAKKIKEWIEKIFGEKAIFKILMDLFKFRVFLYIIPPLQLQYKFNQNNPYHKFELHIHTSKTAELVSNSFKNKNNINFHIACWTALLHDLGKPFCYIVNKKGFYNYPNHEIVGSILAKQVCMYLNFNKKETKEIAKNVLNHLKKEFWLKKFDDKAKK